MRGQLCVRQLRARLCILLRRLRPEPPCFPCGDIYRFGRTIMSFCLDKVSFPKKENRPLSAWGRFLNSPLGGRGPRSGEGGFNKPKACVLQPEVLTKGCHCERSVAIQVNKKVVWRNARHIDTPGSSRSRCSLRMTRTSLC